MKNFVVVVTMLLAGCSEARIAPSSCTSSRECSVVGLVCDTEREMCVECLLDRDCIVDGEHCHGNECQVRVPCMSDVQCAGRVCNPGLGYCVECMQDRDCSPEQMCLSFGDCVTRSEPRPVPDATIPLVDSGEVRADAGSLENDTGMMFLTDSGLDALVLSDGSSDAILLPDEGFLGGNRFSISPVGGFVSMGDLDLLGEFTVMAWFLANASSGTGQAIVSKYEGSRGGFEININYPTGRLLVHTRVDTGLMALTPVVMGVWTHVAFTYSGGMGHLYVDGLLVISAPMPPTEDTIGNFVIGRSTWGGNPFNGQIDEVLFYNHALTGPEIAERMSNTIIPTEEIDLWGYWPFEEGVGTTTANLGLAGSGYNGMLGGGARFTTRD